ncbi:hypothetical protein TI05_16190 [Achromatium sp. WMS3]|nr:hypothetical protein TI05_16190 [Achromatium sp. WMS3]
MRVTLQKRVLLMVIVCLRNTNPKRHIPSMANESNGAYTVYKMALLINADANGAYNILRKSNPKFSFSELTKKVGEGILDWLHPYTRLKIC